MGGAVWRRGQAQHPPPGGGRAALRAAGVLREADGAGDPRPGRTDGGAVPAVGGPVQPRPAAAGDQGRHLPGAVSATGAPPLDG